MYSCSLEWSRIDLSADRSRLRNAPISNRVHPVPRAAILVLASALGACMAPRVVAEIEAAYPDASLDGTASGCEQLRRSESRRFGHDPKGAVLWARQKVGGAQQLPCEVALTTVVDGVVHRVYVLARSADGHQRELVVKP